MIPPVDGPPSNYRLADLTVDVARRCVTRQGQTIELKALDFDLLRFLVEQAPNVVNADDLAEKVWGRHFVSPENVAQRVMLLRQSLSDDANKPRYIETIRNKGYRLIPVVEKVPAQAPRAAAQRSRWLIPAAMAILLSVGIAAAAAFWLGGSAEHPVPSPRSVAVLPFESLSLDPDDAYFAAAMRDEIVSQLTKISGLRVIPVPRSDAMPALAAAPDLNIVAMLETSVYSSDGRVKVTPRLTESSTGVSLWSKSYERELSDIFAIHSDIALDVAHELRFELSDSERQRIERVPSVDPQARELLLRARIRQVRGTPDDVQRAIADVESALEIDPAYVEAWIFDATQRSGAQFYFPENAAEHRARAEYAAREAVKLDPESGSAHAALGLALTLKKDWRGGEAANRKALDLNVAPDASSYCLLKLAAGNFAAARDVIDEARRLQPQNPVAHRFLMFAYAALGDWATATDLYESGMELFGPWREGPNNWMHWLVGRRELAQARDIPADDAFNREMLASLDDPAAALTQLHREHEGVGTGNPNRRRDIGLWAGHFGDAVLAFEAMRAAIDEQGGQMVYVWLPQLAQMRQIPEFKAYLREIGIVDYWKEYGWPDICRPLGENDFECA